MYIPSDFFSASLSWSDVFPLHRPLELGHACQFHIMDKNADAPSRSNIQEPVVDPPDADYRFSAKVLPANEIRAYSNFVL